MTRFRLPQTPGSKYITAEGARRLREEHHFRGYIHLKVIPNADPRLIVRRQGLRTSGQNHAFARGPTCATRSIAPKRWPMRAAGDFWPIKE